jgi:HAD superfamily hydrolase (TIGR01509 family)
LNGLAIGPLNFIPRLIIFDKDGTLIDFHAMWSVWVCELAARLEMRIGRPISARLFHAVDYDPLTVRAIPGGPLAVAPMAELRSLVTMLVRQAGFSISEADAIMHDAWLAPDARRVVSLADLPQVFGVLRARGIALAIATSDDRAATEATLAELGVAEMVSALAAADDALRPKPAPDMALSLCEKLRIDPRYTLVVGDSIADMQMGRAAGVGACIGVLSGVSAAEDLAGCADILLPSISGLIA